MMTFLTTSDNFFSFVWNLAHQVHGTVDRRRNHASVNRIKEATHATSATTPSAFLGDDFVHCFKMIEYLVVFSDFSLFDVHCYAPLMK